MYNIICELGSSLYHTVVIANVWGHVYIHTIQGLSSYEAYLRYPAEVMELQDLDGLVSGGTTAVVAIIFKRRLHIANVGDSRALLVRQLPEGDMITERLSVDHVVENQTELERLSAIGFDPVVLQRSGRLGSQENTRSIGDYCLKQGYRDLDSIWYVGLDSCVANVVILICLCSPQSCHWASRYSNTLCLLCGYWPHIQVPDFDVWWSVQSDWVPPPSSQTRWWWPAVPFDLEACYRMPCPRLLQSCWTYSNQNQYCPWGYLPSVCQQRPAFSRGSPVSQERWHVSDYLPVWSHLMNFVQLFLICNYCCYWFWLALITGIPQRKVTLCDAIMPLH